MNADRIISSVLIIMAFAFCVQCKKASLSAPVPHSADTVTKTMLSLGDSYTFGQSVKASERFPQQTADILKQEGINIDPITFVAKTGWTTIDLLSAMQRLPGNKTYDYVTLLIGVNDEYQSLNIADYPGRFASLLKKAIACAGGRTDHVIVISIPDYSITPFVTGQDKTAVSAAIADYNTINKKIAKGSSCAYIDINEVYREGAADESLIAGDHLHPSGKEYRKWANLLAGYIATLK